MERMSEELLTQRVYESEVEGRRYKYMTCKKIARRSQNAETQYSGGLND